MRCDRGHLGRDPTAERSAHQVHALEAELVEQIKIVEREIGDVLDPVGRRRSAMPWMSRKTHGEIARQLLVKRPPAPGSPAPCRKRSGSPDPAVIISMGVPRTPSACRRRAVSANEETPFGDNHCPA